MRTRLVQGAGRCTRGPNDWALVIILGKDLTKYLLRPETHDAMEPELQAELKFGLQNSSIEGTEALENVSVFLKQGEEWRTNAEPLINDYRHGADQIPPHGSGTLAESVTAEVEACTLAWQGQWLEASGRAQEAATTLGKGGEATRGYRGLWLYLAGVWANYAGILAEDAHLRLTGRRAVRQAVAAAKPDTWAKEMPPLPGDSSPEETSPEDAAGVSRILTILDGGISRPSHETAIKTCSRASTTRRRVSTSRR